MHHPACPAPGLGVRSPRRVPSWAESREDAWSHGGGAGPVGRAGPGPGVVAGLQRAHFLPMLLEGAVIWPSLPQPGLLTQQPQGGGETGFLDKKNPSPGHPWPRFLLRRWEVEPWVLSGFPAGGWGGGWGWSRLWALGSRAVPLPAQPDCPSLGTTLCGSPVPAGCGSRCRLALLSCDSRPGSLGPQEPRLPRPPGPAYLSAQSGVCMCASSSRKPPWVRSPPFTAVVPASHPLEEETGQASEPPSASVLAGQSDGDSRGPGPSGGPGSSVHRACWLRLLEQEGPLPGGVIRGPSAWKMGVGGPSSHCERPVSGPQAASPCLSGGTASPPGMSQSWCLHDRSVCQGRATSADGGFVSPGPAAVGAPAGLGALPAQTWGQNGRGPLGGWFLRLGSRSPGLSSLQQQGPQPRAWVWQDHLCCSDIAFWAWCFLEVLIQSLITAPVSPHPGVPHPGDPHSR